MGIDPVFGLALVILGRTDMRPVLHPLCPRIAQATSSVWAPFGTTAICFMNRLFSRKHAIAGAVHSAETYSGGYSVVGTTNAMLASYVLLVVIGALFGVSNGATPQESATGNE